MFFFLKSSVEATTWFVLIFSAVSKPHASYNVGDYVNLQLMCREKTSLNVTKANKLKSVNFPHLFGDADEILHSKLILANPCEVSSVRWAVGRLSFLSCSHGIAIDYDHY